MPAGGEGPGTAAGTGPTDDVTDGVDGGTDDQVPDERVATWREDGELRRRRVTELEGDAWRDARDRVDAGLEWGVGALVEHRGRVLLVRQDDRWMLPGGEVEDGESHAEALVREFDEETGLAVEPGERLAVVDNVLVEADGDGRRSFRFAVHRATLAAGGDPTPTADPGVSDEEIETVGWHADLPVDTLDRDLLVELTRADLG
jgi:ADP-ribose pyrophosphatase YjhB (NUDIX family)